MSGGHFNYKQYEIGYIADEIKQLIIRNGKEKEEKTNNSWDSTHYEEYSPEVISKFKEGLKIIRQAQVYIHRIDWLVSGDDGEKTFLENLEEDLNNIK